MKYLRIEEVIVYHDNLIQADGGLMGIRDIALLSSAVSLPAQSYAGVELHQTITEKACAYFYHSVKNRPFVDGNKRTAVFVFLVFLEENGIEVDFEENFLFELVMDVANNRMDKTSLVHCIERYLKLKMFVPVAELNESVPLLGLNA